MTSAASMVEALVAQFSAFEDAFESHVFNQDGILPHLFFGEVEEAVVGAFVAGGADELDWRAVLSFLEEQWRQEIPDVKSVISASFLWDLPHPGVQGYDIVKHLPPAMAQEFQRIRPRG